MIWKLEIMVALIFLVEAILEKYVILLKSVHVSRYSHYNEKEHLWSFIYAATVVLSLAWLSGLWIAIPSLFFSRRIFFDYTLKLLRDKPFKEIQGDQFWDGVSRKIFGAQGGYTELAVVLAAKIAIIFIILKFFV